MVSQLFCPRPYRSACDDARSRSTAAHRRGSGHTADVLHEGRPTPRGWGSTGRGLCVLHDSPTYVEYTHPSPSSPRPSCSGQRLRDRDRHGTVDIGEAWEPPRLTGRTVVTRLPPSVSTRVSHQGGTRSSARSPESPAVRIAACPPSDPQAHGSDSSHMPAGRQAGHCQSFTGCWSPSWLWRCCGGGRLGQPRPTAYPGRRRLSRCPSPLDPQPRSSSSQPPCDCVRFLLRRASVWSRPLRAMATPSS